MQSFFSAFFQVHESELRYKPYITFGPLDRRPDVFWCAKMHFVVGDITEIQGLLIFVN